VDDEAPTLITVGVIADAVGISPDRVRRILRTRRHIRPAAYAAHMRLFRSEAIAQVRYEINAMDARRSGGGR
jgi:methylphosphotriester-DNA--protein-cysteine methyltransferase